MALVTPQHIDETLANQLFKQKQSKKQVSSYKEIHPYHKCNVTAKGLSLFPSAIYLWQLCPAIHEDLVRDTYQKKNASKKYPARIKKNMCIKKNIQVPLCETSRVSCCKPRSKKKYPYQKKNIVAAAAAGVVVVVVISYSSPISACQTKPTHAKRLVALLDGGEQSNSESNKATSTRKPLFSKLFAL